MSEIKCFGCGVTIQTEDPNKLGYAPKKTLEKEEVICQRCFRLKNYNELATMELKSDDFLNILNSIGDKDALVVKIVDIFDFSGSFIPGVNRFVMDNPVLLVGNKRDLLPKSIKDNKLLNWLKKQARDNGLKVVDAAVMSAVKGYGIDEVMELIEEYRENRDVYIIGCTNVGKSSFVNQILKRFANEDKDWITTSHFPGTTLDVIEIPLDEETNLVDTPGIINEHQMAHYITPKTLKAITPKKEVKPMVYQLDNGQTLYFGGLGRMDFISGQRTSFICHFSREIPIHRCKTINADKLYEDHIGIDILIPPSKEDLETLPKLTHYEFKLPSRKVDLVISGLGWITINEPNAKVIIHAPKGVGVFLRDALI